MNYTAIEDINTIDLDHSAIIEASAGTGKTYTIENLVIRLLKEKEDIQIENILIVTFTEKATCELKIRIREKIEKELEHLTVSQHAQADKLKEALDTFDAAPIFTIHGFCHSLLRDFAFENKVLFKNDVIDDEIVFNTLLREQMRSLWPVEYKGVLKDLLAISGFDGQKEGFASTLIQVAKNRFKPLAGDLLLPDIHLKTHGQILSEVEASVGRLKTLVFEPDRLSKSYERLNIRKNTKDAILNKIIIPIENLLLSINDPKKNIVSIHETLTAIEKVQSTGRKGIKCIVPENWLKKGSNLEVCPNLEDFVIEMNVLIHAMKTLSGMLPVATIKRLQEDVAEIKRQNGWISYDDMLSHVAGALDHPGGRHLIHLLQNRYKVAFVDEFQDTDPVQWKIFRKLFLPIKNQQAPARLFLIGDPKQAIYAFRGADVFTYLDARNEMEKMAENGWANCYSLKKNWRSDPELVRKLNIIFGSGSWFPPLNTTGPYKIGFSDAESPDIDALPEKMAEGAYGVPPLTIVDVSDAEKASDARAMMCRYISSEILRLIHDDPMEIVTQNGFRRKISYDDICILVRGKTDFNILEPILDNARIPYTYYKKPGLFQSRESQLLHMVFGALVDPGDESAVKKALLTPFFNLTVHDLSDFHGLSANHPINQVLSHWHHLAISKNWGALFQSMTESSGILFRESVNDAWERAETNYRQVFDYLETYVYEKNLDFVGMVSHLGRLIENEEPPFTGADIHQIDTISKKVQVMTMHVSKGLEFPVVFIAGGLTKKAGGAPYIYHLADQINTGSGVRKVIDLSGQTGKSRSKTESEDEDKRLFYVSLTRAKFKLYIPFYPQTAKHASMGPVCGFVSASVASAFDATVPEAGIRFVRMKPQHPGSIKKIDDNLRDKRSVDIRNLDLTLPEVGRFTHRKTTLESFSSLHFRLWEKEQAHKLGYFTERDHEKEPDEPISHVQDPLALEKKSERLPGGARMGSMFHDILEQIDYSVFTGSKEDISASHRVISLIDRTMHLYQIDAKWKNKILEILQGTLQKPIALGKHTLVLGELEPEDRLHEVEFFYDLKKQLSHLLAPGGAQRNKGSLSKRYLRGFIDLIFRFHGKYYIADWKSNIIEEGYDRSMIEKNMTSSGYILQYSIYTLAVLAWLKKTMGKRFCEETDFGGVFYFYLRGMGRDNQGVYHVPFDETLGIDPLRRKIDSIIKEKFDEN